MSEGKRDRWFRALWIDKMVQEGSLVYRFLCPSCSGSFYYLPEMLEKFPGDPFCPVCLKEKSIPLVGKEPLTVHFRGLSESDNQTMAVIRTDDVPLPMYRTKQAAGLDLPSAEDVLICPGEIKRIRTGIKVEIPDGHEGQVRGRSGLAFRYGIFATHIGTIDADYRGEIYVLLENKNKSESYRIRHGEMIGQLVISPIVQVRTVETNVLTETERGENGFGSTDGTHQTSGYL